MYGVEFSGDRMYGEVFTYRDTPRHDHPTLQYSLHNTPNHQYLRIFIPCMNTTTVSIKKTPTHQITHEITKHCYGWSKV